VLYGPCAISANSPSPVDLHLYACAPASGPLGAAAYRVVGSSAWVLRGWLYDPDVSLVADGTAAMTGTWQAPLPVAVHWTGAPADVGWTFNLARIAAGERIAWFQSGTLSSDAGRLDARFAFSGGGDGLYTELGMQAGDGGSRQVFEYRAGTPSSLEGDLAADLITRPLGAQWTTGELLPGGPTGVVGVRFTTNGAGDYDGIVARTQVVDEQFNVTRWTVVMPPVAAGQVELRMPALPADLVDVWANRTEFASYVMVADTPARSYAEFRRDAEPEHHWNWMRHPLAPAKVRVSTSF
jgi:hypothetical protein